MTRRYDPRRARSHLSYTRAELAKLFNVSLKTLCAWKSKGLQPIDGRRPYLFTGTAVRRFLEKHNKPRERLGPGEIYCVACKRIVKPADGVADYMPIGPAHGNLIGTCPGCSRRVWRRVRRDDLIQKAGDLKVHNEDVSATLSGCSEPPHTKPSRGISL